MACRTLQRASYVAAHAIAAANTTAPHLATPGARQTHKVDTIAGIIQQVFGALAETQENNLPLVRFERGETPLRSIERGPRPRLSIEVGPLDIAWMERAQR